MDSIKAVMGFSPHMGTIEHLSIYINEQRLDEILSKVHSDFWGLIPSWLDYYDEGFESSLKEKQYVWQKTKLSETPVVLPIMLCPDDFDFSCTVIVVEVNCKGEKVFWNRFGMDITPFIREEDKSPKYIGKDVTWFSGIKSFVFPKSEYLLCVSQFSSQYSARQ